MSRWGAVYLATGNVDNFVLPKNTLRSAFGPGAGFVNKAAGYIFGGYSSAYLTSVQKLTFASDTVSTLGFSLSTQTGYQSVGSSSTNVYTFGGYTAAGSMINTHYKMVIASESYSTLSSTSSSVHYGAGAGNTSTSSAAYWSLGYNGSYLTTVNKLLFSNETAVNVGNVLTNAVYFRCCLMNRSGGNAYFCGGSPNLSSIDRFSTSTETASSISATLSTTNYGAAGTSSLTAGYIAGGYDGISGGGYLSRLEKLTFSTEARSSLGNILTVQRYAGGSCESSTFGYAVGGYNGAISGPVNTTDKLNFSTDAVSQISGTLSATNYANFGTVA